VTSRFEETDLSKIEPVSIEDRHSKVSVDDIVDPRDVFSGESVDADTLMRALPDILAADSLKQVVSALRTARDEGREIIWLIGAHLIKVGLSGYLNALIEDDFVTCVSSTGSATIHDLELAMFGKTSEDVARELPVGRFGMAEETSQHFNAALHHASVQDYGLGAGMGDYLRGQNAPHQSTSVFCAANRKGIPATVHMAFGTDITHQRDGFPADLAGELTMRDFRILTHRVGKMFDGGVVMLIGSAVILPEVFLKAVSINYNLGLKPSGVTAASFDMLPQYRVRENVLSRPFQGGGTGYAITGHHEIMLPLLYFLLTG
jgi:hypothetical protein